MAVPCCCRGQADERTGPQGTEERIVRAAVSPGLWADVSDVYGTMKLPLSMLGHLVKIVDYGRSYHQNIHIHRNRSGFAPVPGRPGAKDVRLFDASDIPEEIGENWKGAKGDGQKVGEWSREQRVGYGGHEAQVPSLPVSDQAGLGELADLVVHRVDARANRGRDFGKAVLGVGMQIEQGKEISRHARAQEGQQGGRLSSHKI